MLGIVTLCMAQVLAATGPAAAAAPSPSAAVWSEYEARQASAGSGAAAEAGLALWCESHGLAAERRKHLARAVLLEPNHALARGLLGFIAQKGRWVRPEAAAAAVENDPKQAAALAEYNARRDALDTDTAEAKTRLAERAAAAKPAELRALRTRSDGRLAQARLDLGLWCKEAGLAAEASVELTSAVLLDPELSRAWYGLGYENHDGRWMPPEQARKEEAAAKAQEAATNHWEPILKRDRSLLRENAHLRAAAEGRLSRVNDPLAVEAVKRVLCRRNAEDEAWAVRILSGIATPGSTRLLAHLAVDSRFTATQDAARAVLKTRPESDYVEMLVERIHPPARYTVQPVAGPGSKGVLVVDTPRYHLQRSYDAPPAVGPGFNFFGYIGYDANGLPVAANGFEWNRIERDTSSSSLEKRIQGAHEIAAIEERTAEYIALANLKAVFAQQRLAADINDLEYTNTENQRLSATIGTLLRETAGAPDRLGDDETAWHRWYFERVGYSYTPAPQIDVYEVVPSLPPPYLMSCFARGTLVRTISGLRPIEQIRAGDRVLSQDTAAGALGFEPVMVAHHNPPCQTIRITLDNGTMIVPSTYHRFWICGQGWAMARDLKPGNALRILDGRFTIRSAVPGDVVPVYNLTVAHHHAYFVGEYDCLVHDNTLPAPGSETPFDSPDRVVAGPAPARARR